MTGRFHPALCALVILAAAGSGARPRRLKAEAYVTLSI
jgi:hypothetical protein